LLDWLRGKYAVEKPSNKLLAVTDLDSDTWVGEAKHIRDKKLPLTTPHAPRSGALPLEPPPAPSPPRL
jgi:hypothetical protein